MKCPKCGFSGAVAMLTSVKCGSEDCSNYDESLAEKSGESAVYIQWIRDALSSEIGDLEITAW